MKAPAFPSRFLLEFSKNLVAVCQIRLQSAEFSSPISTFFNSSRIPNEKLDSLKYSDMISKSAIKVVNVISS